MQVKNQMQFRDVFKTLSNVQDEDFCKSSLR